MKISEEKRNRRWKTRDCDMQERNGRKEQNHLRIEDRVTKDNSDSTENIEKEEKNQSRQQK